MTKYLLPMYITGSSTPGTTPCITGKMITKECIFGTNFWPAWQTFPHQGGSPTSHFFAATSFRGGQRHAQHQQSRSPLQKLDSRDRVKMDPKTKPLHHVQKPHTTSFLVALRLTRQPPRPEEFPPRSNCQSLEVFSKAEILPRCACHQWRHDQICNPHHPDWLRPLRTDPLTT